MKALQHVLRWFYRTFRTRVEYQPDPFGRGTDWHVKRPDWWSIGSTSGVSDKTPEIARARLDEWQDDMWRRA